jgi:hypothetical protein
MSKFEKVVTNMVNGQTGKIWMARKNWSKQEFASIISEFLTCGQNVSLHDFLSSK